MHRLLQELHRDHVNLNKVLLLLDSQVRLLGEGQANIHVLSEIVDYMQVYPDLLHNPREDVIFRVYQERFPECPPDIDRLFDEHRTLIARTVELRSCMDQWRCDSPLPREYIASLFADYLLSQREHIDLEEGSVFGLLDEGLTEEDWERIEAAMPRGSDPLFDDLMRRRYENIFDEVMAYAD